MGRKAKFSKEVKLKIIREFYYRSKSVSEMAMNMVVTLVLFMDG